MIDRFRFISRLLSQTGKERKLGFDPCALGWLVKDAHKQESRAEFILVGGSSKECTIYSREGFKLGTVCAQDAWIWCCCAKPDGSAVVNARSIDRSRKTKGSIDSFRRLERQMVSLACTT